MRISYANDNFSKYGTGGNYLTALIAGTFCILITFSLCIGIIFSIFPDIYRIYLTASPKVNSKLFAVIIVAIIFILLKISFKEEDLKDPSLTKEIVTKGVNYLIAYIILALMTLGILGLKFLRHYKS